MYYVIDLTSSLYIKKEVCSDDSSLTGDTDESGVGDLQGVHILMREV